MKLYDYIIYSLFPKRCKLCGEVIEMDKTFCAECEQQKRINGDTCAFCGCELTDCSCSKKDKKMKYKCVVAPYYYVDGARRAVQRLKFSAHTQLVENMSNEMFDVVSDKYAEIPFDFVTYTPITFTKKFRRSFNQSELLAKSLSKRMGLDCVSTLKKIKPTRSQHKINAKKRKLNLKNSMRVKPNVDLKGKTVLLVDDVKTTGTTLNECAIVLKNAGVKNVYAVTFTVTYRRHL